MELCVVKRLHCHRLQQQDWHHLLLEEEVEEGRQGQYDLDQVAGQVFHLMLLERCDHMHPEIAQ